MAQPHTSSGSDVAWKLVLARLGAHDLVRVRHVNRRLRGLATERLHSCPLSELSASEAHDVLDRSHDYLSCTEVHTLVKTLMDEEHILDHLPHKLCHGWPSGMWTAVSTRKSWTCSQRTVSATAA